MKSIEFYYDFGSPTAYLAWTQIKKADAEKFSIEYIPVLLGGIFKATGNQTPASEASDERSHTCEVEAGVCRLGQHGANPKAKNTSQ